jgi:hypothetical protein
MHDRATSNQLDSPAHHGTRDARNFDIASLASRRPRKKMDADMKRYRGHRHAMLVPALLALVVLAARADAQTFPRTIARPNNRGDQVIFYYDVRDGFTSFLSLRNGGSSELHVSVLFYGPEFAAPFTQLVTLPTAPGDAGQPANGGLVVIDVGALKASGLPAQAGVAIATAVDAAGQPIVTRSLAGNFTVANLRTSSAWGSSAAARSAIQSGAATGPAACPTNPPAPQPGTVIDGTSVALTPIQPGTAELAAYFNPDTLAPAALGGNQLIFINFDDVPGLPYQAKVGSTTWFVKAVRNSGVQVPSHKLTTAGIVVSDLATAVGAGVTGSSGSVLFTADSNSDTRLTRLVFFTEALGTFGTGYLLPRK